MYIYIHIHIYICIYTYIHILCIVLLKRTLKGFHGSPHKLTDTWPGRMAAMPPPVSVEMRCERAPSRALPELHTESRSLSWLRTHHLRTQGTDKTSADGSYFEVQGTHNWTCAPGLQQGSVLDLILRVGASPGFYLEVQGTHNKYVQTNSTKNLISAWVIGKIMEPVIRTTYLQVSHDWI